MKVWIIIGAKLILIWFLVWLTHNPALQTRSLASDPLCLDAPSPHRLCAHCFKRDNSILPNKGYRVTSDLKASVLKIKQYTSLLSCQQFLQMIDFNHGSTEGESFSLENLGSIRQIIQEIKGSLSWHPQKYNQSEYVVQPWNEQFVVFRWLGQSETTPSNLSVTSISSDYYNDIHNYTMIGFNFVVVLVLVAWLADSSFLKDLPRALKLGLLLALIPLQLSLLIGGQWFILLGRVMILNLGLLRMKVNNLKIIASILLGIILGYFPFTLLIYTGLMTILVAYYGKDQSQTQSVKFLLVIFQTVLLLNYSYWYQYALYLNDIPCKIIEYSILLFIPTGIFMLPTQKVFRPLVHNDPQRKSIRLHGYDEEEQETTL